jgi:glutaminase
MTKYQALLNEIYNEVLPMVGGGKVSDYIPALADIDPHKLRHL